ncbi:MAG: carboxymuconolactone decarboxylase family protein [Dehalococcoidia bacterium]
MARIRLLRDHEAPEDTREIFRKIEANGAKVLNLYRAVGHSPSTVSTFIKLGNVLLNRTVLPPHLRELAILRIATLLECGYEWTQHEPIARGAGITESQLNDVARWDSADSFSEVERAVLRYTDEVTLNNKVSDETFSGLERHLDERDLVELTLAIGYWGMIARVLVPLEIEVEDKSIGSTGDLLGRS